MGTVDIYALADPRTGDIRYVGSTRNSKQRLNSHLYADKSSRLRTQWIRELRERGLKPELLLLETTEETKRIQREHHWYKHFKARGHDLLNDLHTPVVTGIIPSQRNTLHRNSARGLLVETLAQLLCAEGIPSSSKSQKDAEQVIRLALIEAIERRGIKIDEPPNY